MSLLGDAIKSLIVDNLDSNSTAKILSARCGKVLKNMVQKKDPPLQYIGATMLTSWVEFKFPDGHNINDYEYFILVACQTTYTRPLASTVIPVINESNARLVSPNYSDTYSNECVAIYAPESNVYQAHASFRNDKVYLKSHNSTYCIVTLTGKLKGV